MRKALFISLLFSLIWSCRPEPKLPRWDVEVLSPLAQSRLDIRDIFQDSSLNTNDDGSLSLVFQTRLAELKPNEVLSPLNEEFVNTVKLANIDLGSPQFSDYISLGDLSKGGDPAGQFIIANHGNIAIAPPFPNVGPKSFTVNASNIFQDISLVEGTAEVTFQNDLPVAITAIDFRLENQSNGAVIFQANIDTLAPQQTLNRNFDLAGLQIEGQMLAVLQNFSSPGSGTQNVLIDTSDRITITVKLKDLVPSSATALFPDQVLAMDTNYSDPLPTGNALLTSIQVSEGKIYLDATSTIEDVIKLDYQIPSASQAGSPLSINEQIPAAPSGSVSNSYTEVDIAGYTVDLTGQPGDVGIYNQFYTILSGRIDSSGTLINLSTNDSLTLKTGVEKLRASRGFGYLGEDTLQVQETSDTEVFRFVESGSFDLEEAKLGFSVENYIGAPLEMRLIDLYSANEQSQVSLVWDQLNQYINVPAASVAEPQPIPGYLEVELNAANSNFDELIELQPTQFTTDLEAIINGLSGGPVFNQFIYTQYGVRSSLFLEVPMHFSLSDILLTDTTDFNYEAFDPRRQVQDGVLKVLANNYFPVDAQITLVMLDGNNKVIDSLQSPDRVLAPAISPEGRPTEVKRSVAEYTLTPEILDQLFNTRQMIILVTLNSPNQPQKVRLFQDQFLDLTLSGDLRIRSR